MQFAEKEIPTSVYYENYVDVPKFAAYCRQCPNYGRNWSCSPYDFDPADLWKSFASLRVIACKVYPEPGMSVAEAGKLLAQAKAEMMSHCYALEKDTPGSLSLFAGSCRLCAKCTRPEGKPCVHPDSMRYSIESIGGDVGRTVKDLLGIELKWGTHDQPPEYYVLCGGLLMK